MILNVVTDRLSGASIGLVLSHIESVRIDHAGINSASAFTITMSSGKQYRVRKDEGERVIQALNGRLAA